MSPDASCTCRGICSLVRSFVRNQYPQNVDIQEVIDDVHSSIRACAGRSIKGAFREVRVSSVKRGFEKVRELVEDVGDFIGVGAVIYDDQQKLSESLCYYGHTEESDQACVLVDEVLKGRPGINRQNPWAGSRDKSVGLEPRGAECSVEETDVHIVSICQE